jgi:hypothetical protein
MNVAMSDVSCLVLNGVGMLAGLGLVDKQRKPV